MEALPDHRSRAAVQAALLPLRVLTAVYWYGGGRFVHTSRAEERLLSAARATATTHAGGYAPAAPRR